MMRWSLSTGVVWMSMHNATPIPDTVIRERDHEHADGNTPADYPLLARCGSCHREIRIEVAMGSGWEHTFASGSPRDLPARASQASGHRPTLG
jgi:hypothetical protein